RSRSSSGYFFGAGIAKSSPRFRCLHQTRGETDCGPANILHAMATKPAGTAIAENPQLSLLGAALKRANVLESLNRAPALTVFAPTDQAFEKLPTIESTDRETLVRTLARHILTWRLSPDQLPGRHTTLGRTDLTIENNAGIVTVDGVATVVCANVQTTNAVVYIIDAVLES
ncbi:fasciclin domain-containing protein, partial [Actinoplanes sp. NPDC051343]|uniref:fasciclin domain-containing protein n=1 Tax=Actinoplanes sp. NPDC051343 TaxID=3363906 RepID=UPI0037A0AB41